MIETYCWADTYATQFYKTGGQSRFLEARFLHACDTIAKVIRKRMFPVIEKQVERVDRAVIQICNDKATIVNTIIEDPRTSVEKASDDIRQFALRQLEEAGDIDVAHRLATVWKMEYVYDEEVLKAALAARREKYLQWEELFPAICVPELLATPAALIKAFSNFRQTDAVLGFDVEWGDEHQGAALLQMGDSKTVILVDIPALSKHAEGANALEQTVGRLFASSNCVVVGFGCRQDLSKLRSSPCARDNHWLGATNAVIDLQALVANIEPSLGRLGLSRCCEHYLGKPLDKSEQVKHRVDDRIRAMLDVVLDSTNLLFLILCIRYAL